jgi:hypothetical protein
MPTTDLSACDALMLVYDAPTFIIIANTTATLFALAWVHKGRVSSVSNEMKDSFFLLITTKT